MGKLCTPNLLNTYVVGPIQLFIRLVENDVRDVSQIQDASRAKALGIQDASRAKALGIQDASQTMKGVPPAGMCPPAPSK